MPGRARAHVPGLRAAAAARPGAHASPARHSTSTCSTRTIRSSWAPRPGVWPGRPADRWSSRTTRSTTGMPTTCRCRAQMVARRAHPVERAASPTRRTWCSPRLTSSRGASGRKACGGRSRCCRPAWTSIASVPATAPLPAEPLGLAADDRVLLYVGRLDREKNLEFLLDAIAARPRPASPAAPRGAGDAGGRAAPRGGARGPGRTAWSSAAARRPTVCPRTTARQTPSSSRRRPRPRAWPSSRRWPAVSRSWRSGRAASRRSSPKASPACSSPRSRTSSRLR